MSFFQIKAVALPLILAFLLVACGSKDSKYIGNWQSDSCKTCSVVIAKNGDHFLFTETPTIGGTRQYAAAMNDGILKIDIGMGAVSITIDEANGKLITPHDTFHKVQSLEAQNNVPKLPNANSGQAPAAPAPAPESKVPDVAHSAPTISATSKNLPLNPLWHGTWSDGSNYKLIVSDKSIKHGENGQVVSMWLNDGKVPKKAGSWSKYDGKLLPTVLANGTIASTDKTTAKLRLEISKNTAFKAVSIFETNASGEILPQGDCQRAYIYDNGKIYEVANCETDKGVNLKLRKFERQSG